MEQFIKSGFENHHQNRDGLSSPPALAKSYGMREDAQGFREKTNVMLELKTLGKIGLMAPGLYR